MTEDPIRILIVEARFYDDLADALLEGATQALTAFGAEWVVICSGRTSSVISVKLAPSSGSGFFAVMRDTGDMSFCSRHIRLVGESAKAKPSSREIVPWVIRRDRRHRHQGGDEAIFDGRGTGFVAEEAEKRNRQCSQKAKYRRHQQGHRVHRIRIGDRKYANQEACCDHWGYSADDQSQ
eukprot:gene56969-78070_t